MKRVVLLTIFICILLCACGSYKPVNEDKLKIVVSIGPEYDWARNIVGDVENVDITLLTENGADMHSYEPSADDIITISTCDVFIYVGGESDAWAKTVLANKTNKSMIVINLLETLEERLLDEEYKEGMQGEAEEEPEADEHVWLSVKNACVCCEAIEAALSEIDSTNAKNYKANYDKYVDKLNALDKKYTDTLAEKQNKTIVVVDRFPFRYLVNDYGLDYYAAFLGCSAESEISFRTITFLADKVKELKLEYIVKLEASDDGIANTIVQTCKDEKLEIVKLNSMQNITLKSLEQGLSYIDVMEENLEILNKILN